MIIFNEAKPKYEKLDQLLENKINDIRFSNQINIIVDLKEIARKFFRPDIMVGDNITERQIVEEISSDIINIVAHYRNYFYKKGRYTTFYFLYSFNKCTVMQENFSKDYKKEYYEKYMDSDDSKVKLIRKALKIVESVLNITPNAHFIETSDFDEYIYAKYITSTVSKNQLTVILTNDDLFIQLITDNVVVLSLKGIKSELLTSENYLKILSGKETSIPITLFPLVLSISGLKKYSIKGISNSALLKSIKTVETLIERELIDYKNLISLPIEITKLKPTEKFENNILLNIERIKNTYLAIKGDNVLFKNKLQIVNKFVFSESIGVAQTFKGLNSKIFTTFPLQLDMMLKGETLK